MELNKCFLAIHSDTKKRWHYPFKVKYVETDRHYVSVPTVWMCDIRKPIDLMAPA